MSGRSLGLSRIRLGNSDDEKKKRETTQQWPIEFVSFQAKQSPHRVLHATPSLPRLSSIQARRLLLSPSLTPPSLSPRLLPLFLVNPDPWRWPAGAATTLGLIGGSHSRAELAGVARGSLGSGRCCGLAWRLGSSIAGAKDGLNTGYLRVQAVTTPTPYCLGSAVAVVRGETSAVPRQLALDINEDAASQAAISPPRNARKWT